MLRLISRCFWAEASVAAAGFGLEQNSGNFGELFLRKKGNFARKKLLSAAQLISSSLWFASLSFCSVTN
jgi:hypothetical protein